jgi:hypothetical protein
MIQDSMVEAYLPERPNRMMEVMMYMASPEMLFLSVLDRGDG